MCGIAGIVDLYGHRELDRSTVERMADAILHRGPDENGALFEPGIGICHRRLSIVGLNDGQQPIYNEDRTVAVVMNGEFFDYVEQREDLEAKGHRFSTSSDSEVAVHLYEEYGEDVFLHLKGQYAVALIDLKHRKILLGRDRVGICPLHWTIHNEQLYFGSEIKAILASGEVPRALDPKGLDQIFTFFAMPTQRTMFHNIQTILPGHYMRISFRNDGQKADITDKKYWDFDFPEMGDEINPSDPTEIIDQFDAVFAKSVEKRMRADVPVAGYLSGGVDSAFVLAHATKIANKTLSSFTIGVDSPKLDETNVARAISKHIGTKPNYITADAALISDTYPDLVQSADCPVIDTSCAALRALSKKVHDSGYKVVLTGEGSDEALAGYVWFKAHAFDKWLQFGNLRINEINSRLFRRFTVSGQSFKNLRRIDAAMGGTQAQSEFYNFISAARHKFYSDELKEQLGDYCAFEELPLDLERMKKWHPLNQSLYIGYKTLLAGMLLNHKGDRVAMANSVETRYPFLDEDVIHFTSQIHPRWKLHKGYYDKYILRQAASRYLPPEFALRRKQMFRAPMAESFLLNPPDYVEELLSAESLAKTGYFNSREVIHHFNKAKSGKMSRYRLFTSMGLVSVLSTQLWHHLYLDDELCSLPRPNYQKIKTPSSILTQ